MLNGGAGQSRQISPQGSYKKCSYSLQRTLWSYLIKCLLPVYSPIVHLRLVLYRSKLILREIGKG